MIAYRLTLGRHAALDGEGARLFGGRWNSPGRPMLYASASPSLPVLEVMVHLDLSPELLPDDYRLLTLELPDDARIEALETVPEHAERCLALGDDFLVRGEALVMSVPSVIVPQDRNLLVNPLHSDAARIRMVSNAPFRFDGRLFGKA